nr:SUMF1/EgtB/PvdO family nonheme iron enzyme [Rothia sp. P100]
MAGLTAEEHDEWNVPEARRDFETPQRQVTIDQQFAMSQTVVTVNRFQACVDHTGY